MIQLKLKLNSKKPTTVYAVNGKTYLLNPGSNVLNLEYDDYLSLAKALGIKPVENKKAEKKEEKKVENEPAVVKKVDKKDPEPEKAEEKVESPAKDEPAPVEDTEKEEAPAKEEVPAEEPVKEEAKSEAPVEDAKAEAKAEAAEEVDYSTWTLKQLKAAYKELTGETCKLKKDEVIAFLQEHHA